MLAVLCPLSKKWVLFGVKAHKSIGFVHFSIFIFLIFRCAIESYSLSFLYFSGAHDHISRDFLHSVAGFYVEGYVGGGAEAFFEGLLDLAGALVGCGEWQGAVHANVQLYGVAAADAASAQVVRVVYVGKGTDHGENVFLHIVG